MWEGEGVVRQSKLACRLQGQGSSSTKEPPKQGLTVYNALLVCGGIASVGFNC